MAELRKLLDGLRVGESPRWHNDLEDGVPDGIGLDAEGAVWYADGSGA